MYIVEHGTKGLVMKGGKKFKTDRILFVTIKPELSMQPKQKDYWLKCLYLPPAIL